MNQNISEEVNCVICMSIFKLPVTLGCGHSFCKLCIEYHLNNMPFCPVCKFPTFSAELPINITLKNIIENYRTTNPELFDDEVIEEGKIDQKDQEKHISNKPTMLFRSRRAKKILYPGTLYKMEIDFKGSIDFFHFLTKHKNFVLIGAKKKGPALNLKEKIFTFFELSKIIKFNDETVLILAMAKQLVQVSEIKEYIYGDEDKEDNDNQDSEQDNLTDNSQVSEREVELLLRKKNLLEKLKKDKNFMNIEGSVEYCIYKPVEFSLEGDFNPDSAYGRNLIYLYQKVNFFLEKLRKQNSKTFYFLLVRHALEIGPDPVLTTQLRIEVAKQGRIQADDLRIRHIMAKGIRMNIFKNPEKFAYLLCMLLNFPPAIFNKFSQERNANIVFNETFKFFAQNKDIHPLFLFKISKAGTSYDPFEFIRKNFWVFMGLIVVILSFYISHKSID